MKCQTHEHAWTHNPGGLPICRRCGHKPHASPSQISTRRDCRRKHSYTRRRPRPPENPRSPSAYGTRCHDIAQAWGEEATPPDLDTPEGRTVASVLPLLPRPQTALHEHQATPIMGGIAWDMRLDWIDDLHPGKYVQIGDLKTTGNFDYAKTQEDLVTTDPQGIVYSHWACEFFDVPAAILRWVYCERTSRPRPRPGFEVKSAITREDAAARFEPIGREAYEMGCEIIFPPEAFPRNLDACGNYGGCEYKKECHEGMNSVDVSAAALYRLRR